MPKAFFEEKKSIFGKGLIAMTMEVTLVVAFFRGNVCQLGGDHPLLTSSVTSAFSHCTVPVLFVHLIVKKQALLSLSRKFFAGG